jgi:cytochrome P450
VVTRYEEVTAVLRDHQRFAMIVEHARAGRYTPEVQALLRTSPLAQVASLVDVDPPEHIRRRSPMNKALSAQRIVSLEPSICQLANHLIDQFEPSGRTDFVAQFAHLYPIRVIGSLLGVSEADMAQLQRWTDDMLTLLFADLSAERQISAAQSLLALHQYIYDWAEQRRRTPQDDLISALLQSVEAGQVPLSPAEAAQLVRILLVAGFETTTRFQGNCLYHLLAERTRWQAIVDDPHVIPVIVEETLRFDTSVLSTFRQTRQAVELGGTTIPQGAMVQVVLSSANHDEALFPDPETFDLQREQLNRHVGFGYGVHRCVGAPLARLETRIALEQLSQRLPSLRLVPDQELGYTPSLILHGLKQLWVEWETTST